MSDPEALEDAAVEEAVRAALSGAPTAAELQPLIEALCARRQGYAAEAHSASSNAERAQWLARVAEVERQIDILRAEAALAGFVEFTVRTAASRARPASGQANDEA